MSKVLTLFALWASLPLWAQSSNDGPKYVVINPAHDNNMQASVDKLAGKLSAVILCGDKTPSQDDCRGTSDGGGTDQ